MKNDKIMSRAMLETELQNICKNGIPTGMLCGLNNIDNLCRLDMGMLVTITGIPNMGKSEFIDFLVVQYNKLHHLKTLFYSPENQPIGLHLSKLYRKFEGCDINPNDINGNRFGEIMDYIYNNFYFFNYRFEYTVDTLLATAETMITEVGINILVIDSYNKLNIDIGNNETEAASRFLDKLQRYAIANRIMILLVAHPRKMEREPNGAYKIPKGYDINGSANFLNKSDVVLSVHRNYVPNYTIIHVDKVRFNNYGGIGDTYLGYNIKSGNFYDIDEQAVARGCRTIPSPPQHQQFVIPTNAIQDNKTAKQHLYNE